MSEKIFLKLHSDLIVAESEEFLEVWGCMRVCVCASVWSHRPTRQIVSKSWPLLFFVLQRPNFDSEAILSLKMYARLQVIASNFFRNFLGEAPRPPPVLEPSALSLWLRLTGPPFPKFLDPPLTPVAPLSSACMLLSVPRPSSASVHWCSEDITMVNWLLDDARIF